VTEIFKRTSTTHHYFTTVQPRDTADTLNPPLVRHQSSNLWRYTRVVVSITTSDHLYYTRILQKPDRTTIQMDTFINSESTSTSSMPPPIRIRLAHSGTKIPHSAPDLDLDPYHDKPLGRPTPREVAFPPGTQSDSETRDTLSDS
jgi:hypothetical protein